MENGVGKVCPLCNAVINENDEVVSCKVCNTVHHKSCWATNGGCFNVDCRKSEKRCPKCAALVTQDQMFCPECGESLKRLCVKCGAELQPDQAFCVKCGQKVEVSANQENTSPSINQFNSNISNKNNNKILPIIIGVVCLVVVLFFVKINSKVNFKKTFDDINDNWYCEIAEDGSWMRIDTNPLDVDDYYNSHTINDIKEVNKKLGFTDSVYRKMLETRSIDGRQSDENNKVKVSWTYHPDRGLEVLYEVK